MPINPKNIISLLQIHFNAYQQSMPINSDEKKLGKNLISIIAKCMDQDTEFEIFDDLVFDQDANFDLKEGELESEFDDEGSDGEIDDSGSESSKSKSNNFEYFFNLCNSCISEASSSSYEPSPKKAPQEMAYNEKKKALEYYRTASKGFRSLSSMSKNFRSIKTESDLKMLRPYLKYLKFTINFNI